jgi:hypothetical protein
MKNQDFRAGAIGLAARNPRVEKEMAAARMMRSSGVSEIDEVLATVARQLAADIEAEQPATGREHSHGIEREQRGDPGVLEEKTPVVVRVITHHPVPAG